MNEQVNADKALAGVVRFKKHPLAIAWHKWLASPEGLRCVNFDGLTRGVYLENRLYNAFMAGAKTHSISTMRQLLLDALKAEACGDITEAQRICHRISEEGAAEES